MGRAEENIGLHKVKGYRVKVITRGFCTEGKRTWCWWRYHIKVKGSLNVENSRSSKEVSAQRARRLVACVEPHVLKHKMLKQCYRKCNKISLHWLRYVWQWWCAVTPTRQAEWYFFLHVRHCSLGSWQVEPWITEKQIIQSSTPSKRLSTLFFHRHRPSRMDPFCRHRSGMTWQYFACTFLCKQSETKLHINRWIITVVPTG